MKKAIVGCVLILLATSAFSQNVTIGGQDSSTSVPWKYLPG